MGTMAAFARLLDTVDLTQIASAQLAANTDKVKELNIKQLMQGLNNQGLPLSPKYSEDPYFKKPGAWQRYAAWKKKLFPETPFDTPNLIITGVFHGSILTKVAGNQVQFTASASFSSSIAAKYGTAELGLSPDSKKEAWYLIKPGVVSEICRITGAKAG